MDGPSACVNVGGRNPATERGFKELGDRSRDVVFAPGARHLNSERDA